MIDTILAEVQRNVKAHFITKNAIMPLSFFELEMLQDEFSTKQQLERVSELFSLLQNNILSIDADSSSTSTLLSELSQEYKTRIDKLTTTTKSSFTTIKVGNGLYRWFGWATNNFIDREGDILEDDAHKEFASYLDNNPDMCPELWLWHMSGTKTIHKPDWWNYSENGFFSYSGLLTETENSYFQKAAEKYVLAMSHGSKILKRSGNVIQKYRTYEVSVLPLEHAANQHTAFLTIDNNEEKNMNEKMKFLATLVGDDTAKKFYDREIALVDLLNEAKLTKKEFTAKIIEAGFAPAEDNITVADLVVDADVETKISTDLTIDADVETKIIDAAEVSSELTLDLVVKEIDSRVQTVTDYISKDFSAAIVTEILKALDVESIVKSVAALTDGQVAINARLDSLDELEKDVKDMQKSDDAKFSDASIQSLFSYGLDNTPAPEEVLKKEEKQEPASELSADHQAILKDFSMGISFKE